MELITAPNIFLLQKAKSVSTFGTKLHRIIEEMKVILIESKIGVGLAAPQVGLSIRLFLASPRLPDANKKYKEPIKVFINPIILNSTRTKTTQKANQKSILEGCLSIPNIWGHIERNQSVTLSYQNELGKKFEETFNGFWATIIQHEVDHLEGILFTSHVLSQGNNLYRQIGDELKK